MARVVVHAGAHMTGWGAVHRHLVAAREELATHGVLLPNRDEPARWHGLARALGQDGPAFRRRLGTMIENARKASAEVVLLSSPVFGDVLHTHAGLERLKECASALDVPVQVVVVVRDQLGYLNQLYCNRVTNLAISEQFDLFVADPQPSARFDYLEAFGSLLGAQSIGFVAVPYAELDPSAPAKAVLEASGLDAAFMSPSPHARSTLENTVGPVLITAARLLQKRATARAGADGPETQRLAAAATQLRRHAQRNTWDTTAYWGWTAELGATAIERYRLGNESFAREVWGRSWPDMEVAPPEVRELTALEPPVVADVVDTVDTLVKALSGTGPSPQTTPTARRRTRDAEQRVAEDPDEV